MKVKDCMTTQVISVGAMEPVSVAARLMARQNVGLLPVKSWQGQLEGVITDRDIVLRCIAADRSPKAVRVRDIMSARVTSVRPETDAAAAAQLMAKEQIRRLPVVDGTNLVGMVSLGDLCKRPDYTMEAAQALEVICTGVRHLDSDLEDF